jgi:hypothetical protein
MMFYRGGRIPAPCLRRRSPTLSPLALPLPEPGGWRAMTVLRKLSTSGAAN